MIFQCLFPKLKIWWMNFFYCTLNFWYCFPSFFTIFFQNFKIDLLLIWVVTLLNVFIMILVTIYEISVFWSINIMKSIDIDTAGEDSLVIIFDIFLTNYHIQVRRLLFWFRSRIMLTPLASGIRMCTLINVNRH